MLDRFLAYTDLSFIAAGVGDRYYESQPDDTITDRMA